MSIFEVNQTNRGQSRWIATIIDILVLCVGTIILSHLLIYNGFPIFYGDTGGYIIRAFERTISHHWAMFYSYFIAWTSFSNSLIYTALVQNLIVSTQILLTVRIVWKTWIRWPIYLICVCILGYASSLPWMTNMIMSDVFTGIGAMSILLLLFYPIRSWEFWLNSVLLIISAIAHRSHFPIYVAYSLLLILMGAGAIALDRKKYLKQFFIRCGILLLLLVSAVVVIEPLLNASLARKPVRRSAQVIKQDGAANSELHFVWRAMQRTGVYDSLLIEKCRDSQYIYLCDVQLMKVMGEDGYWDDLNKGDLFSIEVEDMAKQCLTTPSCILPIIGDGFSRGEDMSKNHKLVLTRNKKLSDKRLKRVFTWLPDDIQRYKTSRHYNDSFTFGLNKEQQSVVFTIFNNWFFVVLLLGVFILIVKDGNIRRILFVSMVVGISLIAFYYINCLLMASFGNKGNPRYPTRVSWMVLLGISIMSLSLLTAIIDLVKNRYRLTA